MAELTVLVRSHHFVVRRISVRGRPAVVVFARRMMQYHMVRGRGGQYHREPKCVFAASTADRNEFRFHINQLKEFQEHLIANYLKDEMVEWVIDPVPEARQVVLPVFESWKAREDQVPVIDYMVSPEPPVSKFVDLQTGKGKSFCALQAMSILGMLSIIIVKPMYLEKWIIDIRKTYDIEINDVMMVKGGAQLQALLLLAETGELDAKIILLSNKTLQNWLKLYELNGSMTLEQGYACLPDEMYRLCKIGSRLIDEVHQDFHLNFKADLYSHVKWSGSLSATLVSDDDFTNRMYEVAYPAVGRYKGPAYDKYIAARSVIYKLRYPNKVRTKFPGSQNYSHNAYEQSLIKQPEALENYQRLILRVLKGSYQVNYKKGQRCAIYCASIDLCTIVTEFLKRQLPQLDVRRYVEDDAYENLMEADVAVTTLLSAGTAVDIPNLTTVILTVSVMSTQSNLQGFGRLRKLADGTVPEFYYFVCEDIPKQVEYHEKKRVLLQDRATNYKSLFIPELV